MDQIPDISGLRVTEYNPALPQDEFDPGRCAALHNHILHLGWVHSGRDLADLPQTTFWDLYGSDELSSRLAPHLVNFFQNALVTPEGHSFTFSFPYMMDGNLLNVINDLELANEDDIALLYCARQTEDDPKFGILFNQRNYTCMYMVTADDSATVFNGRKVWVGLDTLLDRWIDMIESGKMFPQTDDFLAENVDLPTNPPWAWLPVSDSMTQRTLDAWEGLITAIEGQACCEQGEGVLFDEFTCDQFGIDGFAKEFLSRARRPGIRYVAPGIVAPDERIGEQPYGGHDLGGWDTRPICLFRGDDMVDDNSGIFGEPFTDVACIPAGLWLYACTRNSDESWEDGSLLLLPFDIGGNGWAKASDGSLMGEDQGAEEAYAQGSNWGMYTDGWNPFGKSHSPQLYKILEHWKGMVEKGYWEVDGDGVVGGMGKWGNADTEEEWEAYQITQDW